MSEHQFTDETATVIVLNSLVRDMHHALGRIALGCTIGWFVALTIGVIDALRGEWFGVALDLGLAASFFAAGYETSKRRRKYRPGETTPTTEALRAPESRQA